MLRPYTHRRRPSCASSDTGDDGHRVARLQWRRALGKLPDVPVVHVDVHKAAQPAVAGKEMRLQRRVLAGEPVEQLSHTPSLQLDRVTPAHERAERRRDQNRHCHTTFRSSLVIGSSSNVPRSCVRTQLFSSPARPRPTPTITYDSQGQACSRSNADGAGGWSGCEWYTPITSRPSRSSFSWARRNDSGSMRYRLRAESVRWFTSGTSWTATLRSPSRAPPIKPQASAG